MFASALTGFSGVFAFVLLRGLWVGRVGTLSAGFDLAAAVLLIVVCALTWRNLQSPASARVSWLAAGLTLTACALALLARAPGVHA